MIIDKSTHNYLLECMYDKTTHMKYYGQFPVGIRFHLGIIDNHNEMKRAYESDSEYYIDDLVGCQKKISIDPFEPHQNLVFFHPCLSCL